jgi:hypothetical protein
MSVRCQLILSILTHLCVWIISLGASPARTDAAVRIAKPITNILRSPNISDSLPPSSNSALITITYALILHCKSDCENPNCCCIAGSATPMIDVSIMTRSCAS